MLLNPIRTEVTEDEQKRQTYRKGDRQAKRPSNEKSSWRKEAKEKVDPTRDCSCSSAMQKRVAEGHAKVYPTTMFFERIASAPNAVRICQE
jgi:hypothetical protein